MNKSIKGNYEIISKMKCEHDNEIIEEEYLSEVCVHVILECKKCHEQFKGIIYKDLQNTFNNEPKKETQKETEPDKKELTVG